MNTKYSCDADARDQWTRRITGSTCSGQFGSVHVPWTGLNVSTMNYWASLRQRLQLNMFKLHEAYFALLWICRIYNTSTAKRGNGRWLKNAGVYWIYIIIFQLNANYITIEWWQHYYLSITTSIRPIVHTEHQLYQVKCTANFWNTVFGRL